MPIQQMLLGGGGVYTPYVSPYNLTDVPSTSYTNNSVLPGSSNKIWVWNGGKGLFVTSSDIFTEATANSQNSSNTGNRSYSTTGFIIPEGLAWIYAVAIGGGGGGSSAYPPRPGGGGAGFCFAKIDLRYRIGQTITLSSGAGGNVSSDGGDSTLDIAGTTFLTGGKGEGGNYGQGSGSNASGGPGGSYAVDTNSDIIYSYGQDGGKGGGDLGTAENGEPGACGGGGCSNGASTMNGGKGHAWWGSGGAGADSGSGGTGGQHEPNYTHVSSFDSARGTYPLNSNKEHSLVSGITFFGDSTSLTAFDGRNGGSASTSAPAGYFGGGGGGSANGSGSPGGPGALIIWWE